MADNITAALTGGHANRFKEAISIEASRIFDSTSDKDCLEDLQVYFTATGQRLINEAALVKCKSAEVLQAFSTVEEMLFNRGFHAVDISFYFRVRFSVYAQTTSAPVEVLGLALHSKRVILFGSESTVRAFRSDEWNVVYDQTTANALPTAHVKIVEPLTLLFRLLDTPPTYTEPLTSVPTKIARAFDAPLVLTPAEHDKAVLVTLGIFTIVTLQRSAQVMIPIYDYTVPEKDCGSAITTEDPCEMFRRIRFPVQEFFPDNLTVAETDG